MFCACPTVTTMPPRMRRRIQQQGPTSLDQVLEAEQLRARLARAVAAATGDLELILHVSGALDYTLRCSTRLLCLTVDTEDPLACACAREHNLPLLRQPQSSHPSGFGADRDVGGVHLVLRGGPEACAAFLETLDGSCGVFSRVRALTAPLTEGAVHRLAAWFPRLERLDITGSTKFEAALVLRYIAPHLVHFVCAGKARDSDTDCLVGLDVGGMPRLRRLDCRHQYRMRRLDGLEQVAGTLTHLCVNAWDGLAADLRCLHQLEELDGWVGPDLEELDVTATFPRLRRWVCDLWQGTVAARRLLAREHLTLTELRFTEVTRTTEELDVRGAARLEVLSMTTMECLRAAYVSGASRLASINLCCSLITDLDLSHLPSLVAVDVTACKHLRRIDITNAPRLASLDTHACDQEPELVCPSHAERSFLVKFGVDCKKPRAPAKLLSPYSTYSKPYKQRELLREINVQPVAPGSPAAPAPAPVPPAPQQPVQQAVQSQRAYSDLREVLDVLWLGARMIALASFSLWLQTPSPRSC